MEATALKMAAGQRADELLAMLENAQQLLRVEAEANDTFQVRSTCTLVVRSTTIQKNNFKCVALD